MSYAEDLIKLRKRVLDAVALGVVDGNLKDFYEATLLQIMNESERQRQHCLSQAETLRKQASVLDGQAQAFSSMSSVVYNVLNAYIVQAERNQAIDIQREADKAEKDEYIKSLEDVKVDTVSESTTSKKTKKR